MAAVSRTSGEKDPAEEEQEGTERKGEGSSKNPERRRRAGPAVLLASQRILHDPRRDANLAHYPPAVKIF